MASPSPSSGVGNVHKSGPVQVRKPAPVKPAAPKPQGGRKGGKR